MGDNVSSPYEGKLTVQCHLCLETYTDTLTQTRSHSQTHFLQGQVIDVLPPTGTEGRAYKRRLHGKHVDASAYVKAAALLE